MIFVTVGTTPFPFSRMRDVVQRLAKKENEPIIFQHGSTDPVLDNSIVKNVSFLTYPQMRSYIKKARTVICHGGPATIFQVLGVGKIPLVLPRRKKFFEHIDDHQLYFFRYMQKRKLVQSVRDKSTALVSHPGRVFMKQPHDLEKYLNTL